MASKKGSTWLEDLERSLPPGWTVCTRSGIGNGTHYSFFFGAPSEQTYFGPKSAHFTGHGLNEARIFASGLIAGRMAEKYGNTI